MAACGKREPHAPHRYPLSGSTVGDRAWYDHCSGLTAFCVCGRECSPVVGECDDLGCYFDQRVVAR